jgi:hypothetical protein
VTPGTKRCLAVIVGLAWSPAGAVAQGPAGPDLASPPPATGAPPPASAPAPAPALDQWLAPPGTRIPIDGQAAAIAVQEGLGPQAAPLMMQFFRPRRIAVARARSGSYVFTLGDVERVVSETAFLDSFVALTGSNELDRFRVARPRPVGGILLAAGGVAVAYVAGGIALGCAAADVQPAVGQERHSCSAKTSGAIAVGGLFAAVLGVMMISQSQSGADNPDLHRIPIEQADEIVQRYNLALLRQAARLIRTGDTRALFATTSPRPRRPAPPRLGLSPLGVVLRF